MREIKPIGQIISVSEGGFVKSVASMNNVVPMWHDVLSDIVEKYKKELGESLHSIYLRGSVAAGTAVSGFSDIDTFALVNNGEEYIRWKEVEWSGDFKKEMQEKYDFVRHIDLNISSYADDPFNANPKLAMVLKTQSCCLFGESIIDIIKEFRPGPEMILNLRWLNEDLGDYLKIPSTASDYVEKSAEILKIIIRCGFELIMERVQKYTNSLYFCQDEFGKVYPEHADTMKELLHYFLNPELCGKDSEEKIRQMGEFIQEEAQQVKF